MKNSTHFKTLALASALTLAVSTSSHAVTKTWDAGAAPDLLWSNGVNWNTDGVPAIGDDVVFGLATGTTSATTTSIVGTDITVKSLLYQQHTTASFHTTEINSGITLTLTNGLTVLPGSTGTSTTTIKNGTGNGALSITGGSVDVRSSGSTSASTLDLSGLNSFTFNNSAGNVTVGFAASQSAGILKLAASNTITATAIRSGLANTAPSTVSEIQLGSSNTVNVGLITLASERSSSKLSFQTGLTNAGVTIRGTAGGSSRADLNLGVTSATSTATGITGTFDLTGASGTGTVDVLLGAVKIGEKNHINATAASTATGVFSFNRGTVDATSILAGSAATSAFTSTAGGIGTINVSGNGTLTQSGTGATDFILGRRNVATAATGNSTVASGTLNVSGTSVVTVNASQLTLGDNSVSGNNSVSAIVNLDGGTLGVKKVAAGSSTGGTANVRTFNFNGGELKALASDTTFMQGLTTASVKDGGAKVNTNGFDVTIGQQLAHFAGATTDSLTKSGAGALTLTGTNTYTGTTTVSTGTLLINGNNSGATGNMAVSVSGAKLGGSGTLGGDLSVVSGGILGGGDGTTGTTLTSGKNITLSTGAIIELTLGGGLAHSSLTRTAGTWAFDSAQQFTFNDLGATVGTYTGLITGLGADPGTTGGWLITNSGWAGTFSYNAGNVDLNLTAVPEPATWALLAFSLTTVMVLRRRRKNV